MSAAPISAVPSPKLRKRVEADLRKRSLSRDTVVAAVVRLLDAGRIRVGNEAYVQSNKSYGATTLRNRHAKVEGKTVKMRFKAKSGIERELSITDRTLSRIVRRCQDLPGQHLFQYVNGDGEAHPVSSTDVNDYIREATGEDFTAKHFRTWSASVIAFEQICAAGEEGVGLNAMLEPVAEALGNTPAISRKSYVHPALIDAVKDGASERARLAMSPRDEISVERRAGADRLPRQAGAESQENPTLMNQSNSLDARPGRSVGDMAAWLSSHSLQIILGIAAGARHRRSLLLGVRWLGMRICRTDPDHSHWRTVLGRVLAGTRLVVHDRGRGAAGRGLRPGAGSGRDHDRRPLHRRRDAPGRALGARADPRRHRAPRRRARGEQRPRQRDRHHPPARHHRHLRRSRPIVVLDNLGVNVTGLVAGLGIGGIAIGLAAQGIFADLFAALVDHLRQAVPPRRFDPLGHDLGHGRAYRAQDRPGCARSPARRW